MTIVTANLHGAALTVAMLLPHLWQANDRFQRAKGLTPPGVTGASIGAGIRRVADSG